MERSGDVFQGYHPNILLERMNKTLNLNQDRWGRTDAESTCYRQQASEKCDNISAVAYIHTKSIKLLVCANVGE
jgi:hypothetical protein